MSLPEDVQILLERAFPTQDLAEAVSVLAHARIEDGTVPNHHLVRCAAFASAGNLKRLKHLTSQLAVDWRDVIMAGEYELRDKVTVRVRDLSQPLQA